MENNMGLLFNKPCEVCGKMCTKRACKRECTQILRRNDYLAKWRRGEVDGMRGQTALSYHIQKYLFQRAQSKCERCGWGQRNQFTKRVPLEVNHIDGNHRNNAEENLELICPNCHALTSTYRSLNKGNGRPRKQ